MKPSFLALTVILPLFLGGTSAQAQEAPSPENMFRWFPQGNYETVTFKNNTAAQNSDGFHKLKDIHYIHNAWNKFLLIPEALKKHWAWMVEMKLVKVLVSINTKFDDSPGNKQWTYNTGYQTYRAKHIGDPLQIITFSPDINLGKIVQNQAGVTKTDKLIRDIPVYQVQNQHRLFGKQVFYIYITDQNQILASTSLTWLVKMVQAGYGEIPGVYETFPFPELLEVINDLHDAWVFDDQSASMSAIAEKLKMEGKSKKFIKKFNKPWKRLEDYIFDYPPTQLHINTRTKFFIPDGFMEKFFMARNRPEALTSEKEYYQNFLEKDANFAITVYADPYLEKERERILKEKADRLKAKETKASASSTQEKAK